MTLKKLVIAVSLGLVLAGSVTAETVTAKTVVIAEPEVRTIIVKEGYGDPITIVREGDFWRATSVGTDSPGEVTVFVDANGKLLGAAEVERIRMTKTTTTTTVTSATPKPPATPVTEATVEATVIKAGFHNVHDIDMLNSQGVWKAEADDSAGEDYELHVDAMSGLIVHIEDD